MKYCSNCGTELDEQAAYCPQCGSRQKYGSINKTQTNQMDEPSLGYAVLGFMFPLIGLILYLVWSTEFPKRAKSCGKGAIISVIINVAFSILIAIMIATNPQWRDAFLEGYYGVLSIW
jgi:uncharacterized membrane protein YvbJ